MNTLIVGDSFVHDIVKTYADCARKDYKDIQIIGLPGAGNDAIANTVLQNFKNFNKVIINWTSTCRYDIHISEKKLIKNLKKGTTNAVIDNKFWLFSGGWRGNWAKELSNFIFKPLYANNFDIEDSWRRTLQHILMVQKTLNCYNKKHLSIFSYDTFVSQSFSDYEKQYQATRLYNKNRWQKYLGSNNYTSLIDWQHIWFHKYKHSDTGGILDWCHDNTHDDSHHPTELGHQRFYHSIIKPWLEQDN